MEKENLILREIDKNDRRNRYYFLSETGERAANEAIEQFKKNMLKIFEPLSEDEMECITKSFDVINQILEKYIKSDNEKI
jgi:DNA-binding MarR family transcriptional regulator